MAVFGSTTTLSQRLFKAVKHNVQPSRTIWRMFRNDFGSFSSVKQPGRVCSAGDMPSTLPMPEYWQSSRPNPSPTDTEIKLPHQVQGVRQASILARQVMDTIGSYIKVGVSTEVLDRVGHNAMMERQCYPSPLNYRGYPKSICTSVNNVCCHGIPDDRELEEGDIISVDVTVYHGGYHGDCCETWSLPGTDDAGLRLVEYAKAARDASIAVCGPWVPFNTIGRICEETAYSGGLTIVPIFIGHGIGTYFHGPPDVYHFTNNHPGVMSPGMTFTVEPILAQGREEVEILDDGWTAKMVDGGRSAQFEHTILVTEDGHEILTRYRDEGSDE